MLTLRSGCHGLPPNANVRLTLWFSEH